jgi:hypothetical protein
MNLLHHQAFLVDNTVNIIVDQESDSREDWPPIHTHI